jgi:hypothetical protein
MDGGISGPSHLGHDPAGRHGVDRDSSAPQLHRKTARQDQDLRLGRRVKRRAGQCRADRRIGSDVDDAAVTALLHPWRHGADCVDHAIDIDAPHARHCRRVVALQGCR